MNPEQWTDPEQPRFSDEDIAWMQFFVTYELGQDVLEMTDMEMRNELAVYMTRHMINGTIDNETWRGMTDLLHLSNSEQEKLSHACQMESPFGEVISRLNF